MISRLSKGDPLGCAISVVVPTWNESAWLPSLITRLKLEQCVSQIIVADNSSDDQTVAIALASKCEVITGGLPAVGRNAGARRAKEDLLLFADADVEIGPDIFTALRIEFARPGCMLVHFRLIPATERRFVKLCYRIVDFYAWLCGLFGFSQGSAPLICVRREAFDAIGGFDETVHAAEDIDFIRRLGREIGGVVYVRNTPVYISARRFELESAFTYSLKCLMWGILRFCGFRISICKYKWAPYSADIALNDRVVR